jgi:imidazolonepropionase-like amidohydrolase
VSTLFAGGQIIDCTGNPPLHDGAVLVEGNRITDIGPADEVHRRVRGEHTRINLQGGTLLPGLWDCHAHLGSLVPPWEHRAAAETEADHAFRCARKAQDNLFAGVTSLRTMGDRFDADLHLKKAIDAGTLSGPRLFVSGDSSWSRGAAGEDEYRRRARALLWKGADHIKLFASGAIAAPVAETITHSICSEAELRAAIDEAHRWGRHACVHAIGDEAVRMAAAAGADSIEHGFVLSEAGIVAMREHDVVFSPQLTVTHAWNERFMREAGCYPDWLIENAAEAGRAHHAAFRQAAAAGLTMIAGVDNLPRPTFDAGIETYAGRPALVSELCLMAENGLTRMQALQAATRNAARVCRVGAKLGTLEPGKLADLIVAGGDPLADVSTLADVKLVMKDGVMVRSMLSAVRAS